MSCSDVLDLIEPIAAGTCAPTRPVRAHLQSCVTCAAALASAQRLESALKGMDIPPAPAGVYGDGAAAHPPRSLAVGAERRPALQPGDRCRRPADGGRCRGDVEHRRHAGDRRFGAGPVAGGHAGGRSRGGADRGDLRRRGRPAGLRARHVVVGRAAADVRRSAIGRSARIGTRLSRFFLTSRPLACRPLTRAPLDFPAADHRRSSAPKTVAEYLRGLDPERRRVVERRPQGREREPSRGIRRRDRLRHHLVGVPLKTFPDTYNGHPLCCAALAAQKNYNSLYLMAAYGNPKQAAALREGFRQHG